MYIDHFTLEQYEETAAVIRAQGLKTAKIGLVLGSGLGDLANEIEGATAIPYSEIPHFPRSTVQGHQGSAC